jgi:hypothetical protein
VLHPNVQGSIGRRETVCREKSNMTIETLGDIECAAVHIAETSSSRGEAS